MISVNEKYIIIQVSGSIFKDDSFYTVWIDQDKGIQEVIGKTEDDKAAVQSYLFDKSKWTIDEARNWLKTKNETKAELLNRKRLFVASSMSLCSSLPKVISNEETSIPILDKTKEAFAQYHDKYFYFVEGVHEGRNGNGAYFYADELTKAYKTMIAQPIDWEHIQEEIIGMSQDVELISYPNKPLAVGYSGVLWRMSPHMQVQERVTADKIMTRDEIIKDRYLKGTLASSMECYFDKIRCTKCQAEFDDWLMFEFHKWDIHRHEIEAGESVDMGLIGIQFVGNGIVKTPADPDAYVISLRTDEDNTLKEIEEAATLVEKYGDAGYNMALSRMVASAKPDDYITIGKKVEFASQKYAKIVDNPEKICPISAGKGDNLVDNKGDIVIMFELLKKCASAKTLNEALAKCLEVLRDFKGDKALPKDAQEAFASEFSAVVAHFISQEGFEVADIFTVTNKEKADAIEVARTEEQSKANVEKTALEAKIVTIEGEKTALQAKITERETEIASLKDEQKNKELDIKVEAFMADLKNDGITFQELFENEIKASVRSKLSGDKPEEVLAAYKGAIVATIKQKDLTDASLSGGGTVGSDAVESLEERFKRINEKYKQA